MVGLVLRKVNVGRGFSVVVGFGLRMARIGRANRSDLFCLRNIQCWLGSFGFDLERVTTCQRCSLLVVANASQIWHG